MDEDLFIWRCVKWGALTGLLTIVALMVGCPQYNVYSRRMSGAGQLAEAESNRRIAILEATAKEEAAHHLASAEIARAKGVAEANKIIGSSLKDNGEYLTWLWIEGLKDHPNSVIYVPTEAGLPILEAGRIGTKLEPRE